MRKFILTISLVIFGLSSLIAQKSQIDNASFESWHTLFLGVELPDHWNSLKNSDNPNINPLAPVVWANSDTAHDGDYSLKLINIGVFGQVATGTMTNGIVHTPSNMEASEGFVYTDTANSLYYTKFTGRPDSLTGWYLSDPADGDHGNITTILHTGYARTPALNGDSSTWVGKANFDFPSSKSMKWKRFSVPFNYYNGNNPEYILIVITSGNGAQAKAGSKLWIDDLHVVFKPTGIQSFKPEQLKVFANNNQLHIALPNAGAGKYQIRVLDMMGRSTATTTMQGGESTNLRMNLPTGIYFVQAEHKGEIITKKVWLH